LNKTTLVIGDAHVESHDNLDRFEALGELIVDTLPDTIVQIGDFLSLDSLSAWDLNKRAKMEGRRLSEELKNGREAVERMMRPLARLRANQREMKKKIYNPRKIAILGNHEDRLYRYLDTHPELIDVVDPFRSIGFERYGWERVDYRDYIYVEGVAFTHTPMNGMNRPISGNNIMSMAAKGHTTSVIFGHTHKFQIGTDTRHGNGARQTMAINCGCYFEGVPEYARGSSASKDWWRGILILEHDEFENGIFGIKAIRMEQLMGRY